MFHSKQVFLPSCIACAGLFLVAGCSPKNDYVEPPPPPVTIAQPVQQTVTTYLVETGATEAADFVEIRARVKGYLEKIHFEPGQEVVAFQEPAENAAPVEGEQDRNKGSLLYEIEPELYRARLNQAQAAKAVAEAEIKNAQGQFDRAKSLSQQGAVSKEELDEKLAALQTAQAQISASDAAIEEAELNLKYTRIYSPIDGRVGKTLVYEGNLVGDNEATHLTTVMRYDPIYANFSIDEPTMLRILDWKAEEEREADKEGIAPETEKLALYLRRDIDEGYPFVGHVNYGDLALDRATGTYKVRGEFPNPDMRILPGGFVRIRIPARTHEGALLVPERVVNLAQRILFVLDRGNNTVERRDVVVGAKFKNMVVIQEGISRDEWVVTEGLQRVVHGAVVDPEEETLPPLELDDPAAEEADASPAEPSKKAGQKEAAPDAQTAPAVETQS
ncbi:MAG: efflux RND transporter periplasmic adaptor subunit [Planctomycetes bacterium]|nr:efflux RND transporter periplasmic adaptor subunit [Planctomycetota bacterium]